MLLYSLLDSYNLFQRSFCDPWKKQWKGGSQVIASNKGNYSSPSDWTAHETSAFHPQETIINDLLIFVKFSYLAAGKGEIKHNI